MQFILTGYSKLSKWDLVQIRDSSAYSKPFNISLFWYYIKQIMNVFIRAMVRIFSFGERWNVPFNSAVASLNGTFHLSPHENILTIALINIHYLYTISQHSGLCSVELRYEVFVFYGSSSTCTIQARGWLIITMKDNKTIEIVFLKNESQTMIIFVSDLFLKANHKTLSF